MTTPFWRATLTLLAGGALAQAVPLLLGPFLARLYSPEAFGQFGVVWTLATNLAVVACARYEFALPLEPQAPRARVLMALCVRVWLVVGVASVAGIRGLPGHGAYCASKAAVIAYCESLRGECRADGVKVVTISPGYIDTPLTRRNPYSMPFLMPVDAFAEKAFRAVEAQRSYVVIPWQMGVVAKLLRLLPNFLFDRALAGRPRKPRRSGAGAKSA